MNDAESVIIRIRGLTNRFGNQTVHENLDLDIHQRDIIAVVGGSGSGKSVLLRSIVGLHTPDAGNIQIFGESLNDMSQHHRTETEQRLGILFQRGALFTSLTVLENAVLPLIEHAKLSRPDAEHLAKINLALVGLPADACGKYPDALSGGMIKRAALARALALDPEVLFLDEPTAGLDPIAAAAFDQLILTLRDALGLTVFLVTHDLDTLYSICDRVAVLANHQVIIADTLPNVAQSNEPWIKEYFHGPRGRAAQLAAERHSEAC